MKDNRVDNGSPDIDWAEIDGRTYDCIDGCALCCLCQPELLPHEEKEFRKEPDLSAGISSTHISPDVTGAAISLRGDHGACYFLREKRCSIYDRRPHFCRTFPLSVFVGWRIQVNANMSCRGMGLPGEDLLTIGRDWISRFSREQLDDELKSARSVFQEFTMNARDASVAQSRDSLRGAASVLADELVDGLGISRILTYAEHGKTRQNSSVQDIVRRARSAEADADLEERAMIDGIELFDLPEFSMLPVYIDEALVWRLFVLKDREIVGHVLHEDGRMEEYTRIDPSQVELMPMSPDGAATLREYAMLVNSRDCFLGHAAHLCDEEAYEYNLAQVYLGALANNILDLWWRASFLSAAEGKTLLGAREVREGVVFFDMDLLDLPTIGAFI